MLAELAVLPPKNSYISENRSDRGEFIKAGPPVLAELAVLSGNVLEYSMWKKKLKGMGMPWLNPLCSLSLLRYPRNKHISAN